MFCMAEKKLTGSSSGEGGRVNELQHSKDQVEPDSEARRPGRPAKPAEMAWRLLVDSSSSHPVYFKGSGDWSMRGMSPAHGGLLNRKASLGSSVME